MREIKSRCWILALIVREDGERLLLGDGAFMFREGQQHFPGNNISNTVVEVQGNNGVMLAGQTMQAANQNFEGYIGDASLSKVEIENYRRQFINFFQLNQYYQVIYILPDGTAIKRQRGFITTPPSVEELWQIHPQYSVALNFEDINYYKYEEDPVTGEEIYGQSATLLLQNAVTGGWVWDENGLVWDNTGAEIAPGKGGTTVVKIDSSDQVYPVWTISGLADNPRLINLTTGQELRYTGRVSVGQTLVIDMLNQTATLNGKNVLPNVSGSWMSFAPGINRVSYETDNNNAPTSKIEWAEVVAQ